MSKKWMQNKLRKILVFRRRKDKIRMFFGHRLAPKPAIGVPLAPIGTPNKASTHVEWGPFALWLSLKGKPNKH